MLPSPHSRSVGNRAPKRAKLGCASLTRGIRTSDAQPPAASQLKIILVRAGGICYMKASRSSERRQIRWFSCRAGMDLRQDRNCNQR